MTYIAGNDDDNNHKLALHNQYQTMWQRAVAFGQKSEVGKTYN